MLQLCVYFQCIIITASFHNFDAQSQTFLKGTPLPRSRLPPSPHLLRSCHRGGPPPPVPIRWWYWWDDDDIMMMVMITCSSQRAVLFSSFSSMSPMGGSSPFGGCWLLFKACGLWGKDVVVQVVWYFLFEPPESLPRGGMSLRTFSASTLCASQEGHWPEQNE